MIEQRYRDEFEQSGPEIVRRQVSVTSFDSDKMKAAYEWLDEKDHGEDRALAREQIVIARDAKDAAWEAARAARAANTRATIALIIATLSAIAAACAVILPHFWKPL
jgi:hypothetical protein